MVQLKLCKSSEFLLQRLIATRKLQTKPICVKLSLLTTRTKVRLTKNPTKLIGFVVVFPTKLPNLVRRRTRATSLWVYLAQISDLIECKRVHLFAYSYLEIRRCSLDTREKFVSGSIQVAFTGAKSNLRVFEIEAQNTRRQLLSPIDSEQFVQLPLEWLQFEC